jgi:CheY-like chemotaxis protein
MDNSSQVPGTRIFIGHTFGGQCRWCDRPSNIFERESDSFHLAAKNGRANMSGMLFLSNPEFVFVVDDDLAMLSGVARVLKQHGYNHPVRLCWGFQKPQWLRKGGLHHSRHQPESGSGIELRRDLKAAGIYVPVIYMTANDNPAVPVAALRSGCLSYKTLRGAFAYRIPQEASTGLTSSTSGIHVLCRWWLRPLKYRYFAAAGIEPSERFQK